MRKSPAPLSRIFAFAAVAALLAAAVPARVSAARVAAGSGAFAVADHPRFFHRGGYDPWWGWGWGWGWGFYGYPYPRYIRPSPASWAAVKTDVEPDEAALYLDDQLIGTADDFDGYPDKLYLKRGAYKLEFRLEGFEPYTVNVDAAPGRFFRIDQRLKKIPGAKRHGTYNPARPAGGIVRYFHKVNGVAAPDDPRQERRYRGAEAVPSESGPERDGAAPAEPGGEQGPRGEGSGGEATEGPASVEPEAAPSTPNAAEENVVVGEPRILFRVAPDDAAVYLDDKFAGSARDLNAMGAGLPASPGEHRITIVRPGYREQHLTVNVGGKEKPKVTISLSR